LPAAVKNEVPDYADSQRLAKTSVRLSRQKVPHYWTGQPPLRRPTSLPWLIR